MSEEALETSIQCRRCQTYFMVGMDNTRVFEGVPQRGASQAPQGQGPQGPPPPTGGRRPPATSVNTPRYANSGGPAPGASSARPPAAGSYLAGVPWSPIQSNNEWAQEEPKSQEPVVPGGDPDARLVGVCPTCAYETVIPAAALTTVVGCPRCKRSFYASKFTTRPADTGRQDAAKAATPPPPVSEEPIPTPAPEHDSSPGNHESDAPHEVPDPAEWAEKKRRAQIMVKEGAFGEALKIFRELCATDDSRASAWFGVGYCCYRLGNFSKSRPALERARDLGHPQAARFIAKIEKHSGR